MNTTTTTSSSTSNNNNAPSSASFQTAFEQTASARAKLEAKDLLAINVDIPSAVATVIGTLPKAKSLRSDIVKILSVEEMAEVDALQIFADALSFAHTAYLAASQPPAPLPELFARATELRDLLASDATALAKRELVDGNVLAQLKGGTGYLEVAYDLGAIVRIMRDNWNEISKRSAVQATELDEAEKVYEQVTRAFAARERQPAIVEAASADRARAFTLFMKAYDQLRRAATFIRWNEDDTDKYVPSVYVGRGGRGNATPKPVPAPQPAPPVTTAPAVAAAAKAPSAPGMPGGSPFANS